MTLFKRITTAISLVLALASVGQSSMLSAQYATDIKNLCMKNYNKGSIKAEKLPLFCGCIGENIRYLLPVKFVNDYKRFVDQKLRLDDLRGEQHHMEELDTELQFFCQSNTGLTEKAKAIKAKHQKNHADTRKNP